MWGSGLSAPFSFAGGAYPGTGGTCGGSLAASAGCTIVVVFSPSAIAASSDALELNYHDGIAAIVATRDLAGTGEAPALLSIDQGPTYDFGPVVNTLTRTRTFIVTNSGGVTATAMTGTGLSGVYSFVGGSFAASGTCAASLAPGASCSFAVLFSPTTSGTYPGTVNVGYHDGAASVSASRALTGQGVPPPTLTISGGPTIQLGAVRLGTLRDLTITVNKTGPTSVTAVGANLTTPFSFPGGSFPGTGTCGNTISAATCTVVVRLTPANAGRFTQALSISYHEGISSQNATVTLRGLGVMGSRIAAGSSHTCAITAPLNEVKCWGENADGRLGHENTSVYITGATAPVVNLGVGAPAVALSSRDAHTCAILQNESVKCWGRNTSGQLGNGTFTNRGASAGTMGISLPSVSLGALSAIQVVTGENHTCALLEDNSVRCWGSSSFGQLGQGTTTTSSFPVGVNVGGAFVMQLAAGANFNCAILGGGNVKCWGQNSNGQLGLGVINTDHRGDGPTEMASLPDVALGASVFAQQLAAGGHHVCVLTTSNMVKCWGLGAEGRLGNGNTVDIGDSPTEMGINLPTVSLGAGFSPFRIAAGNMHTCAVAPDGTVKCWGANTFGGLGLEDVDSRGDMAAEMGGNLSAVNLDGYGANELAVGVGFTCAALPSIESMKCWGANSSGQLGLGDTNQRGHQANTMGSMLPPIF
jgi:alpha-tubulin suppressor-like RCC1 family protein